MSSLNGSSPAPNQGQGADYVPSRWTVSSNVELEASEVDLKSGMVVDTPQRRRRTQSDHIAEIRLKKQEARNIKIRQAEGRKKGIRISRKLGIFALLAMLVVCTLILAAQYGHGVTVKQSIADVRKKTEDVRKENTELEAELAEATDETTISTYARNNLGMYPAKSVEAEEVIIEPGDPDLSSGA